MRNILGERVLGLPKEPDSVARAAVERRAPLGLTVAAVSDRQMVPAGGTVPAQEVGVDCRVDAAALRVRGVLGALEGEQPRAVEARRRGPPRRRTGWPGRASCRRRGSAGCRRCARRRAVSRRRAGAGAAGRSRGPCSRPSPPKQRVLRDARGRTRRRTPRTSGTGSSRSSQRITPMTSSMLS